MSRLDSHIAMVYQVGNMLGSFNYFHTRPLRFLYSFKLDLEDADAIASIPGLNAPLLFSLNLLPRRVGQRDTLRCGNAIEQPIRMGRRH